MAVAWFRALKDTTGAVGWEHADPSVVKEDHGFKNNAISFIDVTPFVSDFVLARKVTFHPSSSATVNPGGFGCSSDSDCKPINSKGVSQCFIPQYGTGKCLAETGSLGANVICYLDQECAQSSGEATCERSLDDKVQNLLWPVPGLCKGLTSQTEVEAPLPENKCMVDNNPDTCGACTAAGEKCAWCFAFKWSAANGKICCSLLITYYLLLTTYYLLLTTYYLLRFQMEGCKRQDK